METKNWEEMFIVMEQFYDKHVKTDEPGVRFIKKTSFHYGEYLHIIFTNLQGEPVMNLYPLS